MVVIKARLTFNSNWQVIVDTNLVLVDAISEQVYQIQSYTYAKSSFVTQDSNILLNDPMSGAHTAAAGREFHCEIHRMEKKRFLTSVQQQGVKILWQCPLVWVSRLTSNRSAGVRQDFPLKIFQH